MLLDILLVSSLSYISQLQGIGILAKITTWVWEILYADCFVLARIDQRAG